MLKWLCCLRSCTLFLCLPLSRSFSRTYTHTHFWNVKQRCVHMPPICICIFVCVCKFTTNGTHRSTICVQCIYFQSDEVHQIAKYIVISMLIDFHFSFDVVYEIFIWWLLFWNFRPFTISHCCRLFAYGRMGGGEARDKSCGAKVKRFSFEWLHLYTLKFIK